jgi:hypothetical protein
VLSRCSRPGAAPLIGKVFLPSVLATGPQTGPHRALARITPQKVRRLRIRVRRFDSSRGHGPIRAVSRNFGTGVRVDNFRKRTLKQAGSLAQLAHYWPTLRLQVGVEKPRSLLLVPRHQVAVAVERDRDRAMPRTQTTHPNPSRPRPRARSGGPANIRRSASLGWYPPDSVKWRGTHDHVL